MAKFEKSLEIFLDCKSKYQMNGDLGNLLKITDEIADIHLINQNMDLALDGYLEYVNQRINFTGCEDHPDSALVLLKMAKVLFTRKDFSKARIYIEKAYTIFRIFKSRNCFDFRQCLFMLGIIYKELSMNEKSLSCFQELFNSYKYEKNSDYSIPALDVIENLAVTLMNLQQHNEAIILLDKHLTFFYKMYGSGFCTSAIRLIRVYNCLGIFYLFMLFQMSYVIYSKKFIFSHLELLGYDIIYYFILIC